MLHMLVSDDQGKLPFRAFLKTVLDMWTGARACLTLGQALRTSLVGALTEDHILLMSTGQAAAAAAA